MIFSIVVGVGVSVFNTRILGPEQYGIFKYFVNLLTFVSLFFTLGFYVSGGRLIALQDQRQGQRELIGSLVLITAFISVGLSIFFLGISFFPNKLINNDISVLIRILFPLFFVHQFIKSLDKILQGSNRIYELAFLKVAPKTFYIIIAVIFSQFIHFSVLYALAIQFLTLAILQIGIIIKLHPQFTNIKKNISRIIKETKDFGIHVYLGILSGVATKHFAVIVIALLLDTTQVGFFALAKTITAPLEHIPATIGTTYFKDFAKMEKMPTKVILFSFGSSLLLLILFIIFMRFIFSFLYTEAYIPALNLSYYIAIAQVLRGLGFFMNKFLGAHGQGKQLRNTAMLVGLSNLLGYFILIKFFGLYGAAFTLIFSYSVYFLMLYYYYFKYIKKLKVINGL